MIANVSQGNGFRGVTGYAMHGRRPPVQVRDGDVERTIDYAYNPAKDALLLDHNLTRQPGRGQETAQTLGREMTATRATRPELTKPVAHFFLRWETESSRRMDPESLRSHGREFLSRWGVDTAKHQYIMVAHNMLVGDPHLHIIVNRVPILPRERDAKGRWKKTPAIDMFRGKQRCIDVCEVMEKAHPLEMVALDRQKGWPKYIRTTQAEFHQEQRTGNPCPRRVMYDAVIAAAKDPRSTSWDNLAKVLHEKDIGIIPWRSKDGQLRGVRFVNPTPDPKTGKFREWKPTKIHSSLTFARLDERIEQNRDKAQRIAAALERRIKLNNDLAKMGQSMDAARAVGKKQVEKLRELERQLRVAEKPQERDKDNKPMPDAPGNTYPGQRGPGIDR